VGVDNHMRAVPSAYRTIGQANQAVYKAAAVESRITESEEKCRQIRIMGCENKYDA